jgi:acyl carrier protein
MPVDLAEWQRQHPAARHSSLLANLRLTEIESEQPSASAGGDESPRAALLAAPPHARRELAESYLRERISRVLGVPSERLDAHQSLNDLGIDSLMAVELRNHVQSQLGVSIPLAKLMQDPTLAQLAQVVLEQLDGAPPPALAPAQPAIPSPAPATAKATAQPAAASKTNSAPSAHSAAETLAQIHELSDDQVDALLRRMLSEEEQQA